jgi:hypothetical protein
MAGKWNIFRNLWNILHFQHLIMCREESTKRSEWFWEKSDHILKPWIFWKMAGKWNIPRNLWNILHFKQLFMCREVSLKHLEWFWKKSDLNPRFSEKWQVNGTFPEIFGTFRTLKT